MNKQNHLFKTFFIISVVLLIWNDWYLKNEYHNYLTGKISDFVGLFAFPYFISCFIPRKAINVYMISGILFMFWKSELSQPLINLINITGIGIGRVVDYSDFMALIVLPISYAYWKQDIVTNVNYKKGFKTIIIGVSCFGFIATTLASEGDILNIKSGYSMTVNKDFNIVSNILTPYENNDFIIDIEEYNATIRTKISLFELDSSKTQIVLDSILDYSVQGTGLIFYSGIDEDDVTYMKNLSQADIEKLFADAVNSSLNSK